MGPLQNAEDINDERILTFNGFLGLILYTSVHEDLRKFLQNSYSDLHWSSGMDLMLLLCDIFSQEMIEELTPLPATYTTNLAPTTSAKRAEVNDKLRRKFEVSNRDLPCIIFYSGNTAKVAYRIPLGLNKDSYGTIFAEICDAAHSVALETPPPYMKSARDYAKWREDCFLRLLPLLRTMRLRLNFKKFVMQAPLGQIASVLKIMHGG